MATQESIHERMVERCAKVYELRKQGESYKKIGEIFGVSAARARQLCRQHDRIEDNKRWQEKRREERNKEREEILRIKRELFEIQTIDECEEWLGEVVTIQLRRFGYVRKEQVEEAFISGAISQDTAMIGEHGYAVIREWLGLNDGDNWSVELSGRLRNILEELGYRSKRHVHGAVMKGAITKTGIWGLGEKSYAELMKWLDIDPSYQTKQTIDRH